MQGPCITAMHPKRLVRGLKLFKEDSLPVADAVLHYGP